MAANCNRREGDCALYCVAQREDYPALAQLFAQVFGGTVSFAASVLEDFAGPDNVFTARQEGICTALLCAVPVTLDGRRGAYYYGLATRPEARGRGVMTGLMNWAEEELKRRGCTFAVLIPAGASLFGFYQARGFEKAFGKRVLRRAIPNDLWAQAEFDTVTAKGLQALRARYAPGAVTLNDKGVAAVLTDLYSGGITTVATDHGYGLFFKKGDTLRFIELFADSDRAAETLLKAARQKTGAGQAVVELGAEQTLFLGEGTPGDYGMIRFFGQPFSVRDGYMRLMLDDEE